MTKAQPIRLLYEQQPNEPSKPFAAFKTYLEMGSERSLAAVGQKLGKSVGLIERWSRRFDWPARIVAHETHLAALEREATEALTRERAAGWVKRREDHREEEWALRGELIAAGRKVLARFLDGSRGATLGDVTRALDLASKLGRLSSGLATETVEQKTEVDVNFRIEVEAAVKKAYGDVVDAELVQEPRKELNDARP